MSAKKEPAAAPGAPAPAGKGKMMLLVVGVLIAAVAAGGGSAWFMTSKAASAEQSEGEDKKGGKASKKVKAAEKLPAQYLGLDPSFVVNLAGAESSRYLQISIQVMTRDAKVVDAIKLHMPAIRNNLLLLFGQKSSAELSRREGRESLRVAALTEVQKVLEEETGQTGVEALYFTSFVTQ